MFEFDGRRLVLDVDGERYYHAEALAAAGYGIQSDGVGGWYFDVGGKRLRGAQALAAAIPGVFDAGDGRWYSDVGGKRLWDDGALIGKGRLARSRLGFLGDSIMQANHVWSATNAFGWTMGLGEIAWANALWPHFEYDTWYDGDAVPDFTGMNAGIGDNTSAQALARVDALLAYSPAVVIISVGVNDVNGSVPAATTMANLKAACDKCTSRGIPVILSTVRPEGVSALPDADPRLIILQDINTLIRAYAPAAPNVHLWDVNLAYDDGAGRPIAGYTLDGTHPSRTGAQAGGASLLPVLQPLFPEAFSYIPTSPSLELLSQMAGTGGGGATRSSGPTAAGWIAAFQGAGTCTCVKSKNGADKQVLTFTIQAAGSAREVFIISRAAGTIPVTPGSWVRSYIRVRLGAWTGWRNVATALFASGGMASPAADARIEASEEVVLDILGPPWQVPVGVTTQAPACQIDIDGQAVGVGVAVVERIALFEVPDPRPLHGV